MSTAPTLSKPIKARTITIRRPGSVYDGDHVPKYFVADDVARSHLAASLSALFPEGEDFFVRSVRAYRDRITDPELRKQVNAFIGQEALHGREHRDFNEYLSSLGYRTLKVDRDVKRALALGNKVLPKSVQLAITVALEHYTATIGETLLREDGAIGEFVDDDTRKLFVWHALEECEHKSVAFDVYDQYVGSHAIRVGTMMAIHAIFLGTLAISVPISVFTDSDARARGGRVRSLARLRRHPFFSTVMLRRLLDFNRRDFHPDDHDTDDLLEHWRAALADMPVGTA